MDNQQTFRDVPEEIIASAKKCPFCGRKEFTLTPKKYFAENIAQYGSATVSFGCNRCDVLMYEFDSTSPKYEEKVRNLINRWNRRGKNMEDMDDGK